MLIDTSRLMVKKEAGLPLNKIKPLFSSNSRFLFIGCGSDIRVYSVSSGTEDKTLRGHNHDIVSICKDPESDEGIISCDSSGMAIFWNRDSHREMIMDLDHTSKVIYFNLLSVNESIVGVLTSGNDRMKICYISRGKNPIVLMGGVLVGTNKIAFGLSGELICALGDRRVFTFYRPFNNKEYKRKHHMPTEVACIECHPTQNIVAVGDQEGCITLLLQPHLKTPVRQRLHWHTLPVADLAFSQSGHELLSAGAECVCVRWRVNSMNKKFLPRLPSPIVFVSVDRTNDCIAASHTDNTISLLDAKEFQLKGTIEELCMYGDEENNAVEKRPIVSTGLKVHSASKCIVLRGREGHLQFYDLHQSKLMFHVDITMMNFSNNEREVEVPNPSITHIEISDCDWMMTCETCCLTDNYTDVKMKFWRYNQKLQNWDLSTCVIEPHTSQITDISLSPVFLENGAPVGVSCGLDGKIKQWMHFPSSDLAESEELWLCTAVEEYLELTPRHCQFSHDGTVVAVSFDHILTIWESSKLKLLGSLSKSYLTKEIKSIEFSKSGKTESLIISCTEDVLCCWDILACNLVYTVDVAVQCLASDPLSGIIAVFAEDETLYFLDSLTSEPIASIKNFSRHDASDVDDIKPKVRATSCTFVPPLERPRPIANKVWRSNYKLCFMGDDKVLYTVNEAGAESVDLPDHNINVDKLIGESHWSRAGTNFSSTMTRVISDQKLHASEEEELKHLSPDSLVKVFEDIYVCHIDSFSSLIKKFSNVVPDAPGSVSADVKVPTYVTLEAEDKLALSGMRDQVQITSDVVNVDFSKLFDSETNKD